MACTCNKVLIFGREENRRTRRKTLEARERWTTTTLFTWVPSLRFSTDGHPSSYWPRPTSLTWSLVVKGNALTVYATRASQRGHVTRSCYQIDVNKLVDVWWNNSSVASLWYPSSGVARMQMLCGHNMGPRLNFSWRFFSYYMLARGMGHAVKILQCLSLIILAH